MVCVRDVITLCCDLHGWSELIEGEVSYHVAVVVHECLHDFVLSVRTLRQQPPPSNLVEVGGDDQGRACLVAVHEFFADGTQNSDPIHLARALAKLVQDDERL